MKKLICGMGFAFVMLMLGTLPVAASGMPTPGDGSAFGEHAAAMSPGLGGMTGASFGDCINTMASTGTCPCSCAMPGMI